MNHVAPPLHTERLLIRPMVPADTAPFHRLVTRPEVARMLFMFPTDWTLAEADTFLQDWAWKGHLHFRLSIEEAGVWRGWIGASDEPEPEVFYALTGEAGGRGLAREALRSFCQFLFDRFDVAALNAGVFHDNPASMRVLQACGFVETNVELQQSRGRDAPEPCHRFRLARP